MASVSECAVDGLHEPYRGAVDFIHGQMARVLECFRERLPAVATIPMPTPAYARVTTVLVGSNRAVRQGRGRAYVVTRYPNGKVTVRLRDSDRPMRQCILRSDLIYISDRAQVQS
jgi:hypothetical protein